MYQQEVTALIEEADQLMTEREPVAAMREWLMSFVEFLDAKHDMAVAMDTLVGGPEPIYSKTPQRLTFSSRRWSPAGSRPASFEVASSRTICGAR